MIGNGTNTSMFPINLQAQRYGNIGAASPACIFVFKTSGYAVTSTCTITMADGLPVELMDFAVDAD